MHKEERDVLEEVRQLDECKIERFNNEKTIAIRGDRWWP